MVKRKGLDPEEAASLFKKTEPAPQEDDTELEDPIQPKGVGLRASEWTRIEEMAESLGMTSHAWAMWSLRDMMKRYDQGEFDEYKRPKLPGL